MAHNDLRTNKAVRPADFTPARNEEFYRFANGDFDITVLTDGHITVPVDIVHPDGSPEQRAEILAATGDAEEGLVGYRTNVPLLRKGDDLILVDIGAGDKYQPSDGKLPASLNAAGIDPDAITKIVLTHGHPDHMWAMLARDGRLRFPNATYYVSAAEWDFWMDPDYLTNMPTEIHEFAVGARRDFSAIRDRVVMLKPGDDIVTGLRALDTAGHTPGHISLEVTGGDGLIISADAATNQIASFRFPKARFGYDAIQDLAIENRFKLIDRAASDRIKLLGYHWTYPGVGFAEPHEQGFRYVPV